MRRKALLLAMITPLTLALIACSTVQNNDLPPPDIGNSQTTPP